MTRARHAFTCSLVLCGVAFVSACGGGVPLLHSAHALAPGQTSTGVGISDRFVLGGERAALDDARLRMPGAEPDAHANRGALVALVEGPALAPWAAARVGLPGTNEAGLSYSGEALRADARHAFESGQSALSLGFGLTGRGFGHDPIDLPGASRERATGYGVDVPVLVGYRTDANLISVWGGVRAGYDRWSGHVDLEPDRDCALDARRLSAGSLLGVAVGVSPLWVALELELDYAHVTGHVTQPGADGSETINGWSVRPAGALIGKF